MFVVLLWNLWLARNAKVFDAPRFEESFVIGSSSQLVSLMVQARADCQLVCSHVAAMSRGLAYWEPPSVAWIKLNTDEAWRENDGYVRVKECKNKRIKRKVFNFPFQCLFPFLALLIYTSSCTVPYSST
ncbi:hypothetical protein V6N13_123620 [Hibiscus sabdariffa]